VASAAELLCALKEPTLADKVIIERSGELDGRNYGLLTALVKTAEAKGRPLAATLIWRSLLDAILARGYAKAYGHAARYLLELRAVSASIGDFQGHPSHASFEAALRRAHGRKTSFGREWVRLQSAIDHSGSNGRRGSLRVRPEAHGCGGFGASVRSGPGVLYTSRTRPKVT
jgi:hypothetical protein